MYQPKTMNNKQPTQDGEVITAYQLGKSGMSEEKFYEWLQSPTSPKPATPDSGEVPTPEDIFQGMQDFCHEENKRGRVPSVSLNDFTAGVRFGIRYSKPQPTHEKDAIAFAEWKDADLISFVIWFNDNDFEWNVEHEHWIRDGETVLYDADLIKLFKQDTL